MKGFSLLNLSLFNEFKVNHLVLDKDEVPFTFVTIELPFRREETPVKNHLDFKQRSLEMKPLISCLPNDRRQLGKSLHILQRSWIQLFSHIYPTRQRMLHQ